MTHRTEKTVQQEKPVPLEEVFEQPYWDGARNQELVVQRCLDHGHHIHPPMLNAPAWCASSLEWVSLGSEITGTLYTWTVVHRPFTPGFTVSAPYAVALCEVTGKPGLRIMGNLFGMDPSELIMGMQVALIWEQRGESSIPQWTVPQARSSMSEMRARR